MIKWMMVYRGKKRNKYNKVNRLKVKADSAKTTGYFVWGLISLI